ncbi:MAG TPA: hypothetical protein VF828_02170 [Patescibacteria group bacterium]
MQANSEYEVRTILLRLEDGGQLKRILNMCCPGCRQVVDPHKPMVIQTVGRVTEASCDIRPKHYPSLCQIVLSQNTISRVDFSD